MDIFMDKLAQRDNAQEIIRANTTAEIKELDALRSRVAEYNDCLNRLQKLVDESSAGWKNTSRESAAEVNRLVEEGLAKIREIQQDASGLEKLGSRLGSMDSQMEKLGGRLGNMDSRMEKLGGQLGNVNDQLSGRLDNVNDRLGNVSVQVDSVNGQIGACIAQLGDMKGEISGQVEQISRRLEEKPAEGLEEKFAIADENVHKECVKVYRNVQAVVLEESGKQGETLAGMSGRLNVVKSRLGIVLGISVAALVFSLAGAVLQILNLLGIGPL